MDILLSYWSKSELIVNGILLLHMLGAASVGLLIGYERSYHGRAAGMRTYALVCLASTMLTAIAGFPTHWFGGLATETAATAAVADPTRVIQGIMTGIGFLGAGVIMKDGFTIRGLSTAASIWMTAAIGVTIGVGFYGAAIATTLLTMLIMGGFRKLESALPHTTLLHLSVSYRRAAAPTEGTIRQMMQNHAFAVVDWTYYLNDGGKLFTYELVLQALKSGRPNDLVAELSQSGDVVEFRLSPSRN